MATQGMFSRENSHGIIGKPDYLLLTPTEKCGVSFRYIQALNNTRKWKWNEYMVIGNLPKCCQNLQKSAKIHTHNS